MNNAQNNQQPPHLLEHGVMRIPILDFYAGGYRLEYDGKYITLLGRDKNYKGFKLNESDADWFYEIVLIPVVKEIRSANPEITEITNTEIVVSWVAHNDNGFVLCKAEPPKKYKL